MGTPNAARAARTAVLVLMALLFGPALQAAAADEKAPFSVDSPVGELLDDPSAKAVLEKLWGSEMVNNPSISMVRRMSFRTVSKIPAAQVNAEKLDAIQRALQQLGSSAPDGSAHGVTRRDVGPLVSGTTSYINGTFVWTGYAYNDKGASTDGVPGGDASYPRGKENSANLIQVQIGLTGANMNLGIVLNTLRAGDDPDDPLIGIAFDRDADPKTGAESIPGKSWRPKGPLGVEDMVLLTKSGAEWRHYEAGEWKQRGVYPVTVDVDSNYIGATIPGLAKGASRQWRVFGVAGLNSNSWLYNGPIYNLAFDRNERPVRWQTERQGEILAGNLDSSEAAQLLDLDKMASGATDRYDERTPGEHVFLYRTADKLPEGAPPGPAFGGGGIPTVYSRAYLGMYQPYVAYVPEKVSVTTPLIVNLHGGRVNHLYDVYVQGGDTWETSAVTINPHGYLEGARPLPAEIIKALGSDFYVNRRDATSAFGFWPGAITVQPLGNGEMLGWGGFTLPGNTSPPSIGERDVLQVMSDIRNRLPYDADHVVLTGGSMGGMGTYAFASRYPDRFAAALPFIAGGAPLKSPLNPADGYSPLFGNMLNVPLWIVDGDADPLIQPGKRIDKDSEYARSMGLSFHHYLIDGMGHAFGPANQGCLIGLALKVKRNPNPQRVRYSVDTSTFVSAREYGYELKYEGAYWISGMKVRDGAGGTVGTADIASMAVPARTSIQRTSDGRHDNKANGRDLCGPNPDIRDGSAWREIANDVTPGSAQAVANAVEGTLVNLDAITLDLKRMGVEDNQPVSLKISGDGPVTLTLRGDLKTRKQLLKDGNAVGTLTASDGTIVIAADFSGSHLWVLK